MSNERCFVVLMVLIAPFLIDGAGAYRSYVPMNGGFERSDQHGNPLNWTLGAEPSADGKETKAGLTDDAWKGEKALFIGSQGTGMAFATIEMPISFSDLRMLHLNKGHFHYKILSSEASGSNLLFKLELMDEEHNAVTTLRFSPPPEHVGDDAWHHQNFTANILESRMARYLRISFSVNEGDGAAPGAWIIDELQINEAPPSIRIGALRSEKALVEVGEVFQLRFNLSNEGGAFFYDFFSSIELDDGLRTVGDIRQKSIGVVEPDIDYEIRWNLVAEGPGVYAVTIKNWSPGNESISTTPMIAVIGAADFSHPLQRKEKASCSKAEDEIVLENPHVRLVFPSSPRGFGLFGIQCWDGYWRDMGVSLPIGHALHLAGSGEEELLLLTPDAYVWGTDPSGAWLELSGTISDGDGVIWSVAYRFELQNDDSHCEVNFLVEVGSARRLLRLSGPQILAGEGGFGAARDQGLFCGLEYLDGGERSSGTDFVHPPNNLRIVPDPLKVTVPLMVIEEGNASIALSWDPLEKWDGTNSMASAKYLSPNWVQNQSNHLMALFVPTIPKWVDENEDIAHTPYDLQKPVSMSSRIMASSGKSILDVLLWWLQTNGIPDLPPLPRTYEETIDLCTTSYKDIAWVPESKAWRHTHLYDARWIFWDPLVALPLWHHSVLTENVTLREEIRAQVLEALGYLGGWGGIDLALHRGDIDDALASGYNVVRAYADTQREDGSWPFTPDKAHEHLGQPGDTSSGWTARRARFLLRFGRITGDPEALAAGFKALKYLDTQTRPEGAQTWELQLHVPDVLASSYVMECYLEAYKISGSKDRLEKAKYWALTGLPFIYLWNPPDRPIMRYGSIPVFGATGYTHPWFGIIVQWNGLDYAYKLLDLGKYDDSLPWRTLGEGITVCGMQMQRYPGGPHEEVLGMYPDAYSAVKGDDAYYFDINPRFISLCVFDLIGEDQMAQTEILNASNHNIHISTVGKLRNARYQGDVLTFETSYADGDTSYAIVGSISKPNMVRVNGRIIDETNDLSQDVEGWTHRPDGILVIKIPHSGLDTIEVVGSTPQPNQRFAPQPIWEFNGANAEGWTNTHMLSVFTIGDGILSTTTTGDDPYMHSPSIRIDGRDDAVATIRMKVSAGTQAQIFWIRKDSPNYSESKSMVFEIIPDGEFHTYEVRLGESPEWVGVIRQMRFDPTNAGDALVEIDCFRIPEPLLILLSGLGILLWWNHHG